MAAEQDSFDFIIIGGGPAGCVLARRLIDTGAVTVLLLEAGPDDKHPLLKIPAGFTKLTGTTYTWGYETVPQEGLWGKRVWYPQARVLGGGSSINAQLYTRGNRQDYDNWAAHGCTGWDYDSVLPYFRRAEDNARYADAFHGQGGPLKVSDVVPHPLTQAFARAAQQAGMVFNPDFNGAEQAGLGYYQVTNRDGRRASASAGYLAPVRGEPRLTLKTDAHVDRIELAGDRAAAVHCAGRRFAARKEILLTAGAIGSPRVLLHSGLGPAEHLREVGIDLLRDLPGVGANLHDHMDIFVVSECSGAYSFDRYKPWYMSAWAGVQFLMFGTGVLASNICDGGGFWYSAPEVSAPDIQFHFLPGSGLEHGLRPLKNGVTLNSAYLRPKSRGHVRLRSRDPKDSVDIDPGYWRDPKDIPHSIAGVRLAREIMAQEAFKPFIAREAYPGPDAQSDEAIKEYAYAHAKTDYHPVGTCKMGAAEDDLAVVTPDLRVKSVEGLRICDSSVMPFVPSCNTNAPTIMIAERAAELILAEHGLAQDGNNTGV